MKPEDFRRSVIHDPAEFLGMLERRVKSAGKAGGRGRTQRERLLEKLSTCYQLVDNELATAEGVVKTVLKLGGFHRELFKLETGQDPLNTARRIEALRRIARNIYRETRSELRSSASSREQRESFRRGVGRIISVYKRNRGVFSTVRSISIALSKMPDVSGDLRVIIAGMPQVGKSTLISRLTNAKPEIGLYPFTTKNIIAGHLIVEPYGRIVLIDTPGILDRPMNVRNIVENRAVLAVKYLADRLLFLFDPTPTAYYSIEEQLNVYREVVELLEGKPLAVALNKADATPPEVLQAVSDRVEKETGVKPLAISALTGLNLQALRNMLVEWLKAGSRGS
ncbi:MAG: GTPase [Thermosphaera sp.]